MKNFDAYLKGYGVACLVLASCLIVKPEPVLVEALGALLVSGCAITVLGRVRGLV